jgi:hypothetical protein
MSERDVLAQLERDGYFEKARAGDHRACGLFARLVAWRLNPNGSAAGWGWLKKGGGTNVEGYSEDAIVLGDRATNTMNVVDIIIGAGAPGARLTWGGFVTRRLSDTWERPQPLNGEQLLYLKPGNSQPVDPPAPPPPPAPAGASIDDVLTELRSLRHLVSAQTDYILGELGKTYDAANRAEAVAKDVSAKLDAGGQWPVYKGRNRFLGEITLTPE